MFDTHCHLNFQSFEQTIESTIKEAFDLGVEQIVIPGTEVASSKRAIEIASSYKNIYAAVGIHPHHVYEYQSQKSKVKSQSYKVKLKSDLKKIEKLLKEPKVVAVGEVGLDRHYYEKTKYTSYQINSEFLLLQKEILVMQIELAKKHKKSLILHNRETKKEFLEVLDGIWDASLSGHTVFHCCEPDKEFLAYAKARGIFIGVDGDVTYSKEKRAFAAAVPLEMLVLETDSPFLLPEPYRSYPKEKKPLNSPKRIKDIGVYIAGLKNEPEALVFKKTTENARKLFHLS